MKWLLLLCATLLVFPIKAGAHSYVTESIPNDGEEVDYAVEEINLYFNAGIERVSTASVYNEHGEEIDVERIEVESPDLTVFLTERLLPGEYVVEWKALGEDTHQTEGSISFEVLEYEVEVVEDEEIVEEELVEENGEEVIEEAETGSMEEESNVVKENEAVESSMGRFLLPIVITGIIGLFVILRFGLKRLRK